MAFDTGHALVIGVGSYQNIPNLNVPLTVEDAQEVAAVLREQRYCSYPEQQVTLLTQVAGYQTEECFSLQGSCDRT